MTTRQYFYACLALPVVLSLPGLALDSVGFLPVLIVGAVVYLPMAIYTWWRLRHATHLDRFKELSCLFPLISATLLGVVFGFPQIVVGEHGDLLFAVIAWVMALIVGYSYVVFIWLAYALLRKIGLVRNEFAA